LLAFNKKRLRVRLVFAHETLQAASSQNQLFFHSQDDSMLCRGRSFGSFSSSSISSALLAAGAAAHSRGLLHSWSGLSPSSAPPFCSFSVPTVAALLDRQRFAASGALPSGASTASAGAAAASGVDGPPLTLCDPMGVATPDKHVFASNDATLAEVERMLDVDTKCIFLRAPPASGKTVLAWQLFSRLKASNRRVAKPKMEVEDTADVVKQKILDAIALATPPGDTASGFSGVVSNFFKHRGVIIVDESHLLWRFAADLQPLFKPDEPDCVPRIFAVSAASECQPLRDGLPGVTPPESFTRFYWHPSQPDYADCQTQCKRANLLLSTAAVRFLWQLGAGHRGVTFHLLRWALRQQQLLTARKEWDLQKTMDEVKLRWGTETNFGSAWDEVLKCRAVKVNGVFSDPQKIPRAFAEVLCGGGCVVKDDATRRTLVVAGLAMPDPSYVADAPLHGLQHFGISDAAARLVVPNSLMARYYRDKLEQDCALKVEAKISDVAEHSDVVCANVLCRVLPAMDFGQLVTGPCSSPLSKAGFPVENAYTTVVNSRLPDVLPQSRSAVWRTIVGTATAAPKFGAVDTQFLLPGGKTCALEAVIDFRKPKSGPCRVHGNVTKHVRRFCDTAKKTGGKDVVVAAGSSYKSAAYKGVWFLRGDVGLAREGAQGHTSAAAATPTLADSKQLEHLRKAVANVVREPATKVARGTEDVEIVGVLVSPAHTRYTLFVRPARSKEVHGPFVLPVDYVPRKLVWRDGKLVLEAAQSYVSSTLDRLPPGAEFIVSDGRSSFPVTPSHPDVMSLKKAIKAERQNALQHIDADEIVVKLKRDGAALGDKEKLVADTEYFFEAPAKP
jgi:hypothetical protein